MAWTRRSSSGSGDPGGPGAGTATGSAATAIAAHKNSASKRRHLPPLLPTTNNRRKSSRTLRNQVEGHVLAAVETTMLRKGLDGLHRRQGGSQIDGRQPIGGHHQVAAAGGQRGAGPRIVEAQPVAPGDQAGDQHAPGT